MHARTLLATLVLLAAPLAGCIVPQNMQTLREDLGYASLEAPDLDVTIRAETTTPTVHEPVEFTADIQGALPETIQLTWDIGQETLNGTSVTYAFEEPGPETVELTGHHPNATDHDTINITVQPNQPPQPAITIPDRANLTTEQPVTLSAGSSTDPNGDPLSFTWELDGDRVGKGERLEVEPGPGLHTVTLTASDGYEDNTQEDRFPVHEAIQLEDTLTANDEKTTMTVTVHEGLEELVADLRHTTNQGADTVSLTLLHGDEPISSVQTDPEPGASSAQARLQVPADQLSEGSYVLEATLEQGIQADVIMDGELRYALQDG